MNKSFDNNVENKNVNSNKKIMNDATFIRNFLTLTAKQARPLTTIKKDDTSFAVEQKSSTRKGKNNKTYTVNKIINFFVDGKVVTRSAYTVKLKKYFTELKNRWLEKTVKKQKIPPQLKEYVIDGDPIFKVGTRYSDKIDDAIRSMDGMPMTKPNYTLLWKTYLKELEERIPKTLKGVLTRMLDKVGNVKYNTVTTENVYSSIPVVEFGTFKMDITFNDLVESKDLVTALSNAGHQIVVIDKLKKKPGEKESIAMTINKENYPIYLQRDDNLFITGSDVFQLQTDFYALKSEYTFAYRELIPDDKFEEMKIRREINIADRKGDVEMKKILSDYLEGINATRESKEPTYFHYKYLAAIKKRSEKDPKTNIQHEGDFSTEVASEMQSAMNAYANIEKTAMHKERIGNMCPFVLDDSKVTSVSDVYRSVQVYTESEIANMKKSVIKSANRKVVGYEWDLETVLNKLDKEDNEKILELAAYTYEQLLSKKSKYEGLFKKLFKIYNIFKEKRIVVSEKNLHMSCKEGVYTLRMWVEDEEEKSVFKAGNSMFRDVNADNNEPEEEFIVEFIQEINETQLILLYKDILYKGNDEIFGCDVLDCVFKNYIIREEKIVDAETFDLLYNCVNCVGGVDDASIAEFSVQYVVKHFTVKCQENYFNELNANNRNIRVNELKVKLQNELKDSLYAVNDNFLTNSEIFLSNCEYIALGVIKRVEKIVKGFKKTLKFNDTEYRTIINILSKIINSHVNNEDVSALMSDLIYNLNGLGISYVARSDEEMCGLRNSKRIGDNLIKVINIYEKEEKAEIEKEKLNRHVPCFDYACNRQLKKYGKEIKVAIEDRRRYGYVPLKSLQKICNENQININVNCFYSYSRPQSKLQEYKYNEDVDKEYAKKEKANMKIINDVVKENIKIETVNKKAEKVNKKVNMEVIKGIYKENVEIEKANMKITNDENRLPMIPKIEIPKIEIPKKEIPKIEIPKKEISKLEKDNLKIEKANEEIKKANMKIINDENKLPMIPKIEIPTITLNFCSGTNHYYSNEEFEPNQYMWKDYIVGKSGYVRNTTAFYKMLNDMENIRHISNAEKLTCMGNQKFDRADFEFTKEAMTTVPFDEDEFLIKECFSPEEFKKELDVLKCNALPVDLWRKITMVPFDFETYNDDKTILNIPGIQDAPYKHNPKHQIEKNVDIKPMSVSGYLPLYDTFIHRNVRDSGEKVVGEKMGPNMCVSEVKEKINFIELFLDKVKEYYLKVVKEISKRTGLQEKEIKSKYPLTLVAHNLAFDHIHLLSIAEFKNCKTIGSVSNLKMASGYYKGVKVNFFNSMNYFSCKLEKIAKDFELGVGKEVFPYDYYNSNNCNNVYVPLGEYCKCLKPNDMKHLLKVCNEKKWVKNYIIVDDDCCEGMSEEDKKIFLEKCRSLGCVERHSNGHDLIDVCKYVENCNDDLPEIIKIFYEQIMINIENYREYYNNLDCKILYNVVTKFWDLIRMVVGVDISDSKTIGSMVMKVFNKLCFQGCRKLKGDLSEFLRQSTCGGRVFTRENKPVLLEDCKAIVMDVNSLYPSVMKGFVKGEPKVISPSRIKEGILAKLLAGTTDFILKIEIENVPISLKNAFINSKNEKGVRVYDNVPVDEVMVSRATIEGYMKYHGITEDDIRIYGGLYYNEGYNKNVKYLTELLYIERKANKGAVDACLKLFLNNEWGVMMKKTYLQTVKIVDNKKEVGKIMHKYPVGFVKCEPIAVSYKNDKNGENKVTSHEKYRVTYMTDKLQEYYSMSHEAMFVLDRSKLTMMTYEHCFENAGYYIYQGDTDSIHMDNHTPENWEKFKKYYEEHTGSAPRLGSKDLGGITSDLEPHYNKEEEILLEDTVHICKAVAPRVKQYYEEISLSVKNKKTGEITTHRQPVVRCSGIKTNAIINQAIYVNEKNKTDSADSTPINVCDSLFKFYKGRYLEEIGEGDKNKKDFIIDKKDFIVDNCKCNNIYNLPEWRDASNFSVLYKSGAPLCRTSFNRKF